MEDNVLKQLTELKSQYQKRHVSVMVGAVLRVQETKMNMKEKLQ